MCFHEVEHGFQGRGIHAQIRINQQHIASLCLRKTDVIGRAKSEIGGIVNDFELREFLFRRLRAVVSRGVVDEDDFGLWQSS